MYIEHHEAQALLQLIQAAQTIIIHRHVRPDPDAIGSQLGLKSLIESTFPDKRVLAAGTTTQGLKWIGSMDKVTAADYQGALVIVCDTANQPRIDGDHYDKGATLVK
ncbi:DHH family phosphoesterase, partial [Abiotrophia defectiva]